MAAGAHVATSPLCWLAWWKARCTLTSFYYFFHIRQMYTHVSLLVTEYECMSESMYVCLYLHVSLSE